MFRDPPCGASWIWKSANRALTGCRQTLDIYHATEHIADAGKALFGKETVEAKAFFERGRSLLLSEGWTGVCRLVGEAYESEDSPARRAVLEPMLRYFVAHLNRLDYRGNLSLGERSAAVSWKGARKRWDSA